MCDSILGVPALRQRREDIPELVQGILRASDLTVRVGHRAMVALTNYAWPGNIPQLERVVKHAARPAAEPTSAWSTSAPRSPRARTGAGP